MMPMKQLLITGFDPFGGEAVNPAWEAVKALPDSIGDYVLTKREIPTVFGGAAETVLTAVRAMPSPPDVILCIGQAGGRAAVTPERAALTAAEMPVTPPPMTATSVRTVFRMGRVTFILITSL